MFLFLHILDFLSETLHLLLNMRTVKDIARLHSVAVEIDISWFIKVCATEIPEFKNVEALFWANACTDNGVSGGARSNLKDRTDQIALIGLVSNRFGNLDAVRSATLVTTVLP